MGATTTTTTERPRPMFLSADNHKISYRSKSGNVLTLQLTNSRAAESLKQVANKDQARNATSEDKEEQKAMWPGVFDTLSFWAAEAVEIAFFGPYDEPRPK